MTPLAVSIELASFDPQSNAQVVFFSSFTGTVECADVVPK